MKACWCILAGTAACIGCINRPWVPPFPYPQPPVIPAPAQPIDYDRLAEAIIEKLRDRMGSPRNVVYQPHVGTGAGDPTPPTFTTSTHGTAWGAL